MQSRIYYAPRTWALHRTQLNSNQNDARRRSSEVGGFDPGPSWSVSNVVFTSSFITLFDVTWYWFFEWIDLLQWHCTAVHRGRLFPYQWKYTNSDWYFTNMWTARFVFLKIYIYCIYCWYMYLVVDSAVIGLCLRPPAMQELPLGGSTWLASSSSSLGQSRPSGGKA